MYFSGGVRALFAEVKQDLVTVVRMLKSGRLEGQVVDETDADRLEEVGSRLILDAGDGTEAELEEANVERRQGANVEAGEALVDDAAAGGGAAGREGIGLVEGDGRGDAGVGAGVADGALEIGGEELEVGGEGGANAAHGGVDAAAGAGVGGIGAVVGAGYGATDIGAKADAADALEIVVAADGGAERREGAVGFGGEGVGGAGADGGVRQAAEVVRGDGGIDAGLRSGGDGKEGEGEDGEERDFSEVHAADSL